MGDSSEHTPTFSATRRLGIGFHVGLSCLALFAIVVMLNYLSARHTRRLNWFSESRMPLTPVTQQFLSRLTNEVSVTAFFNTEDPLFGMVDSVLKEFRHESKVLDIRVIDYKRNPAGAKLFLSRFKVKPTGEDFVLFESGGRSRVVGASELSTYDTDALVSGRSQEVKRTEFKGEMMFTSAIYGVVSASRPKAYFLKGHLELDPEDTKGEDGFGKFSEMLTLNNVMQGSLSLLGTNEVPADCQLLIIAGAGTKLNADELLKLDKYLSQGGRMFVLYRDFPTSREVGLEALLYKWGVATGNDWVRDEKNLVSDVGMVVTNYAPHAVTRALGNLGMLMMLPRSVAKRADMPLKAEAPDVTEILHTSEQGMMHSRFKDGQPTTVTDRKGIMPVAVALEKGALPGVKLERGTTRIVVTGDVLFLSNALIERTGGNRVFGDRAVNWLLDRSAYFAGVSATPIKEWRLVMTDSQMWSVRGIFLLALPGASLVLGLLVWWRRRN